MSEPVIVRAIRRATGATRVSEGEHIQSLWDGYGEVLKFEIEGARTSSVVVKWVRPPVVSRRGRGAKKDPSSERKLRSYEIESHFYQSYSLLTDSSARLPSMFRYQKTPEGFLFVLEDLDAAGFPLRRHDLSTEEVELCLRWLAAFHATFLGTSPEGLWKSGTYWHLGTRMEELQKMTDSKLKRAAQGFSSKLSQCKFKTLVHGDAKPANFCFSEQESAVAAVDFQYVGGGTGMKDVAYLLDCSVSEAEAERLTPVYLDVYFDALRASLERRGAGADSAEVEKEWRALFPVAWADFARFLDGWAPGRYPPGPFSRELIARAVHECTRS